MKKVAIVMFQNMRYAPFLSFYERILCDMGIPYDIIYLNRNPELNEISDDSHISIEWKKVPGISLKFEKLLNFMFYPSAAKKILNKKQYSFIIVLTTMPAVLLGKYLYKHNRGKYLIDIRDYTQENFKPYFDIESKLVKNSAVNIISSPGFKSFLPEAEYHLCHNLNGSSEDVELYKNAFKKAENRPIIISYIGSILYEKQCKQLIDLVVADKRFEMHFYGNESRSTIVSDYVKELGCSRVLMKGTFLPEDKPVIFENSDLVFNCYGNDIPLVQHAISNKHYDGALYKRPLLTSPCTIMAELAGEFSYSLDLDNITDLEKLYQWYRDLDSESYTVYASNLLLNAIEDNNNTKLAITGILSEL